MYKYNNLIVAGIYNEKEFAEWVQNGKSETSHEFIRKLDNTKMGSVIYLGMDWSEVHYGLAKEPRVDLPEYYEEVEIVKEETNENIVYEEQSEMVDY